MAQSFTIESSHYLCCRLQELEPQLVLPHLDELLAAESLRKLGFCFSSSESWWKQEVSPAASSDKSPPMINDSNDSGIIVGMISVIVIISISISMTIGL